MKSPTLYHLLLQVLMIVTSAAVLSWQLHQQFNVTILESKIPDIGQLYSSISAIQRTNLLSVSSVHRRKIEKEKKIV